LNLSSPNSDEEDKNGVDQSLEEVFHDALDFIPSDSVRKSKYSHVQIQVAKGEDEEELKNIENAVMTPNNKKKPNLLIEEDDEIEPERDLLPYFKDPKVKISIWTIIKDSIGKDITKMSVPVYFNDPTNILQKCASTMEYNNLLDEAVK
jgi:hypothetical protein